MLNLGEFFKTQSDPKRTKLHHFKTFFNILQAFHFCSTVYYCMSIVVHIHLIVYTELQNTTPTVIIHSYSTCYENHRFATIMVNKIGLRVFEQIVT